MSDPIGRLNAALSDRYLIVRQLGEGGMATVYLAEDLKHERSVALKVLKPEFAAAVGAARFVAEIKTTANLNHPHVLPLHDSGEAEGFLFYVMPHVEGESLRDRLGREKQLPVDEAVRIATAVANALDHAHRHGVIHRDIKPENILLQDGEPVVADFGIALAVGAAGGARLTETGLSLGTPYYMSPEQATGDQVVGPATDTYALGCVLYEMLIGEPPYRGSTPQAILGKIIAGKPVSATEQRPSIPANVDAAIRCALERLPADRFKGAQDFVRALGDPGFRHGSSLNAALPADPGPWKRVSVATTTLAAVLAVALGASLLRPAPPLPVERFMAPFGRDAAPGSRNNTGFTLSPDGSLLVYQGPSNQLWVRRWGDLDPTPIRGSESGMKPTVSPDGQEVAFDRLGEIVIVSLEGGPARKLMTGTWPHWGRDGYVYASTGSGIVRVRPTGGPMESVTELAAGEERHRLLDLLPGGTGALLMVDIGTEIQMRVVRFETGVMTYLGAGDFPLYAPSGHLVYSSPDGTLMAVAFDPGAMELKGQPVALLENVSAFSLSQTGKLFYSTRVPRRQTEFVWVTRSGQATPVDSGWTVHAWGTGNPAWSLSPDGTRLALRALTNGNYDIWVKELDDGPYWRLTFDDAADWSPAWTPDGQSVTFVSIRGGDRDVWTKRADGTGSAELLYDHESRVVEAFWSPDGEWLVMRGGASAAAANTRDIFAMRPGVDSVARPLLAEEYDEQQPALSPDGRWLAYVSNETGSREVFVRPFPDVNAGRWQVSTNGGIMPAWAHSGRELFFVDSARALIAAEIDTRGGFQLGKREALFTLPQEFDVSPTNVLYSAAPDDKRFLMARAYQAEAREGATTDFVLVTNFFEELQRRVGG